MAFEYLGGGAFDYFPCHYGNSKLLFRGPGKRLEVPYCAVIGGTETYGKFVENPYADLLEGMIGIPVLNLGCMNAGLDVFLHDDTVMEICEGARITVIQIMGAQNMSNKYYSVHPRRNDRFLNASGLLQAIYRDVDFTRFHFTGHLLHALVETSAEKFELVKQELKAAWVTRMQVILERIDGPVVLLWLADHSPEDEVQAGYIESDPMFVDRQMLGQLKDKIVGIVKVIASEEEVLAGQGRMIFTALEELVAQEMMGPIVHERVAQKLHSVMS
ncbi:MAG: DUF6473 family protein [Paracoccaceae bacterium]